MSPMTKDKLQKSTHTYVEDLERLSRNDAFKEVESISLLEAQKKWVGWYESLK